MANPREGDPSRSLLDKHAKRIGVQDGTNKTALREWLEEVSSAKEWCAATDAATLATLGYLVKGRLDTGIRNWIREYDIANIAVTWQLIKNRIEIEFLDADDGEILRKKVEEMRQSSSQNVKEFSREFDHAVHYAYTDTELGVPLILERVIRTFISALRNENIKMLVHMGRPLTLQAAYEAGRTADRAKTLSTESRKEEPMEIGFVNKKTSAPAKAPVSEHQTLVDTIKLLTKNMEAMEARLKKAEEKPYMKRGRGVGPGLLKGNGQLQWAPDGRPICYRCRKPGHMARDRICPEFPNGNVQGN